MGKLIAIGGVSRAGKTKLAAFLSAHLERANVLHQDEFVKPEKEIPKIKGRVDWEHPDSIDWSQWQQAIDQSRSAYEFTLLDGLFALGNNISEESADLKIYLSLDKKQFLRLKHEDQRWGVEPDWFLEHIWLSHFKYGQPLKEAQLIRIHSITENQYPQLLLAIQNL